MGLLRIDNLNFESIADSLSATNRRVANQPIDLVSDANRVLAGHQTQPVVFVRVGGRRTWIALNSVLRDPPSHQLLIVVRRQPQDGEALQESARS